MSVGQAGTRTQHHFGGGPLELDTLWVDYGTSRIKADGVTAYLRRPIDSPARGRLATLPFLPRLPKQSAAAFLYWWLRAIRLQSGGFAHDPHGATRCGAPLGDGLPAPGTATARHAEEELSCQPRCSTFLGTDDLLPVADLRSQR